MKVILYIGHHKVGSTALQVFLSQNWLALARAGILYPAVEARGFSNNLSKALADREQAAELPVNIREPHSALAYRLMSEVSDRKVPAQFTHLPAGGQMLNALRAQTHWLKPEAVILCSEAFANFGEVRPELIRRLCNVYPDAEFEVYCALRRIDDYLVSWHGQRLKAGETPQQLSDGGATPYFNSIHFNFRAVVEAWAEQVPDVRMIVRPYGEILAAGGSTEDFMAQAGVAFPDGMTPAGRANRSLPRAAMEIVRRANSALEPDQARALRQYFLSPDSGLEPVPDKDVEMFGARLRAKLMKKFAPIHDYLSDLTGRDAFFADFDDIARPRPVPEAEAAADLLAQIDPAALPGQQLRDYLVALRRDLAA